MLSLKQRSRQTKEALASAIFIVRKHILQDRNTLALLTQKPIDATRRDYIMIVKYPLMRDKGIPFHFLAVAVLFTGEFIALTAGLQAISVSARFDSAGRVHTFEALAAASGAP